MNKKLRDPLPEEINTLEFNAVWNCIKHWDIGLPQDVTEDGGQLYSNATGNHVVAILNTLELALSKQNQEEAKTQKPNPNVKPPTFELVTEGFKPSKIKTKVIK